jgi:MinD-like ATPase involved in chromosome partitioning or flagellar assembly
MTQIVGIVQVKGGVGRSTIATNLAAIFLVERRTMLAAKGFPDYSAMERR